MKKLVFVLVLIAVVLAAVVICLVGRDDMLSLWKCLKTSTRSTSRLFDLDSSPKWEIVQGLLSDDAKVRAETNVRIDLFIRDERSNFFRQCDPRMRAHISFKLGVLRPDVHEGLLGPHDCSAREYVLRAVSSVGFWPTSNGEDEIRCRRYRLKEFGPSSFEVEVNVRYTEKTFRWQVVRHEYHTDFEAKSLGSLAAALKGQLFGE